MGLLYIWCINNACFYDTLDLFFSRFLHCSRWPCCPTLLTFPSRWRATKSSRQVFSHLALRVSLVFKVSHFDFKKIKGFHLLEKTSGRHYPQRLHMINKPNVLLIFARFGLYLSVVGCVRRAGTRGPAGNVGSPWASRSQGLHGTHWTDTRLVPREARPQRSCGQSKYHTYAPPGHLGTRNVSSFIHKINLSKR